MKIVEFILPEFTNIYGESYNMIYLKACSDEIEIKLTGHKDKPYFIDNTVDMIYMGCMTEEKQELAIEYLLPYKENIINEIEKGTLFLITGNSIECFGMKISGDDVINKVNRDIKALGIFDFNSHRYMNRDRHNSQFIGKFNDMTLLGHRSQYSFSYGDFEDYFIEIEKGIGMNPELRVEGVKKNNFFATYSLGPFLILNPEFTKYLLTKMGIEGNLKFQKEITEAYEYRLRELRESI